MKKRLPIGVQTFSEIIRKSYCYVDKTALLNQLTKSGKYFFISRPRRFGKSLLVSTLASLFAGERELFKGLAIEPLWDWSQSFPVIHISFGGGLVNSSEALEQRLRYILLRHEEQYGLPHHADMDIPGQFSELILGLHQQFGQQVVLLIDEYDKPILDNLVAGRDEVAIAVRDGLKGFYSVIKDADQYVRFCLLTGVSKFSKVSLFSGLNNLKDITLAPPYATLCGYTEGELYEVFADWLEGVDKDAVRHWYNGYSFDGERVYNPFDVLLYLDAREFRCWWFETGSPGFLVRYMQDRKIYAPDLNRLVADMSLLSSFDVGQIEPEALLFQTGYLTIDQRVQFGDEINYKLRIPNSEVRRSLYKSLLNQLVSSGSVRQRNSVRLFYCLESGDPHELRDIFHAFFASIPHDWYRRNQMNNYEGYYCSIVYCYFVALGLDVVAEDATSEGRIDLTVRLGRRIFIMEFKVVEMDGDGDAMAQIRARGYADKYAGQGEVWLIGASFSRETRNITAFDCQKHGYPD